MILLPIGHDSQTVRRLPWVTFAVMGACAVLWLGLLPLVAKAHVRVAMEFARTMEWWQAHPGLAPDPWLVDYLEGTVGTAEPGRLFPGTRRQRGRSSPGRDTPDPREEFARRTGALRAAVESHPWRRFGLVPRHPRPHAFLTHMFLHAGIGHLLGNLLLLFLVGPFIEDAWGRPLYAAFYLGAGLVAALAHVALHPGSAIPVIGASGAIAGAMGAFLVRYWNTRMRFFYMVGFLVRGTFKAPSWLMLGLWFALEAFSGIVSATQGIVAGTAHWAHVGGFAFGAAFALAMRRWRIEERFIRPEIEAKITTRAASAGIVEKAFAAREAGRPDEAFAILLEAARRHPADPDLPPALWQVAVETGRAGEAAPFVARWIEGRLRAGAVDDAVAQWRELRELVPGAGLGATGFLHLARELAARGDAAEAAAALRGAFLAGGTGMPEGLALKIAEAALPIDPPLAGAAARLLLGREDLDPAVRSRAADIEARAAGLQPTLR